MSATDGQKDTGPYSIHRVITVRCAVKKSSVWCMPLRGLEIQICRPLNTETVVELL